MTCEQFKESFKAVLYYNWFLNPFIFNCAFIFFIYHCFCYFSLSISVILKKGTRQELTCFFPYPFIHLKNSMANYEKCASFEKWQSSKDLKGAYPLKGIYLLYYFWQLGLDSSKGNADSIFLYLSPLKITSCFFIGEVFDQKSFPICTANKKNNNSIVNYINTFATSKPHEERYTIMWCYKCCAQVCLWRICVWSPLPFLRPSLHTASMQKMQCV